MEQAKHNTWLANNNWHYQPEMPQGQSGRIAAVFLQARSHISTEAGSKGRDYCDVDKMSPFYGPPARDRDGAS
jgi:hypothetical protein